jgi:hypothetical protein
MPHASAKHMQEGERPRVAGPLPFRPCPSLVERWPKAMIRCHLEADRVKKPGPPSSPPPHPAARPSPAGATNHTENRLSLSMSDTSVYITRGVTTFQRLCRGMRPAIPCRLANRESTLARNGQLGSSCVQRLERCPGGGARAGYGCFRTGRPTSQSHEAQRRNRRIKQLSRANSVRG